ncbi:MAG: GNAT family N-acetyltransferase [Alphaproteobacteria bacterium]
MNKQPVITIHPVTTEEQMQQCWYIRAEVFIKGQAVPPEDEVDGKDDQCQHYLLLLNEQPAATARVMFYEGKAKIQRVAVLSEFQGKGLGKSLMQFILGDIHNITLPPALAILSAQTHALNFYEKLGFEVCSDEYLDSNIPHRDMKKTLSPQLQFSP